MGVFRQLGDPLGAAPAACLCQHHGVAYAEHGSVANTNWPEAVYDIFADGATIVQQAITITERCCVVVNAATLLTGPAIPTAFEIERPLGTIQTDQEDCTASSSLALCHHAAWEVLNPGTYTYYLVNRGGAAKWIHAAWLKIIASDCEG